ncbi:MAG: hypothetical protein OEM29_05220 [Thermoplasmata archaeon]|nr:hypothetical protein [Thermoplasmata archaeon]
MDFVISKVGLSICALLVMSVLGQSLYGPESSSDRDALDSIIERFDDLLRTCAEVGGEVDHLYHVPYLPGGSAIAMTFRPGGIIAGSDNALACAETCYPLHLWDWNGSDLNLSIVDELDRVCSQLESESGDRLRIEMRTALVQSVATTMVFISIAE